MAVWYVRLPASVAKPADARPVELRDHRRRQLVGDQHAGRIEVLKEIAGAAFLVAQVHAQPAGDVVQIALALVQVRIVNLVEHRGHFVERPLDGPFGVDALFHHDRGGAADEHRIVEHQDLRVEDRREVRAAQIERRGGESVRSAHASARRRDRAPSAPAPPDRGRSETG